MPVKNMNLVAERFEIVSQIPGVKVRDSGARASGRLETVDHYFHKLLTTFPAVSSQEVHHEGGALEASTRDAHQQKCTLGH